MKKKILLSFLLLSTFYTYPASPNPTHDSIDDSTSDTETPNNSGPEITQNFGGAHQLSGKTACLNLSIPPRSSKNPISILPSESSIYTLPPEMLTFVFSKLDPYSLARATETCPEWNAIIMAAKEQLACPANVNAYIQEVEQAGQRRGNMPTPACFRTLLDAITKNKTPYIEPLLIRCKKENIVPHFRGVPIEKSRWLNAFSLLTQAINTPKTDPNIALILARHTQDLESTHKDPRRTEYDTTSARSCRTGIHGTNGWGSNLIYELFEDGYGIPDKMLRHRPNPFYLNEYSQEELESKFTTIKKLAEEFELEYESHELFKIMIKNLLPRIDSSYPIIGAFLKVFQSDGETALSMVRKSNDPGMIRFFESNPALREFCESIK